MEYGLTAVPPTTCLLLIVWCLWQVVLKGDIPIGVDKRSVDTWMEPQLFNMDKCTGAPPDYFSQQGQVCLFVASRVGRGLSQQHKGGRGKVQGAVQGRQPAAQGWCCFRGQGSQGAQFRVASSSARVVSVNCRGAPPDYFYNRGRCMCSWPAVRKGVVRQQHRALFLRQGYQKGAQGVSMQEVQGAASRQLLRRCLAAQQKWGFPTCHDISCDMTPISPTSCPAA